VDAATGLKVLRGRETQTLPWRPALLREGKGEEVQPGRSLRTQLAGRENDVGENKVLSLENQASREA